MPEGITILPCIRTDRCVRGHSSDLQTGSWRRTVLMLHVQGGICGWLCPTLAIVQIIVPIARRCMEASHLSDTMEHLRVRSWLMLDSLHIACRLAEAQAVPATACHHTTFAAQSHFSASDRRRLSRGTDGRTRLWLGQVLPNYST